ncbi:hypothetical protein I5M27_06360 [Adhaeribacter sp. BT258]|uniref:DUF1449 family protein n=1 Tax=Adhaeribacter terrigena TaxID=2793070 RepID=A0ABS1BZS0_9BACT|nr:OB-fold-containig protein [Adhaeribacter terrigena]MBK0402600.1 hypothetical protein [Adhaeribacter terrigena]
MTELLQAAVAPANIIPTTLLVFILIYWVSVIVGLLDLNSFHFEIGKEIHIDTHFDAHQDFSVAWLNSILAFFNLGRIPFMVFMSFLILPFWVLAILTVHYGVFLPSGIAFLMLIPNLIASLFIAKILTTPFVKMFAALEKEHDSSVTIIGKVCTVLLPATPTELGQAAVKTEGAPLILNVKTTKGASLQKGETGLVIDFNADNKIYLIEPFESL